MLLHVLLLCYYMSVQKFSQKKHVPRNAYVICLIKEFNPLKCVRWTDRQTVEEVIPMCQPVSYEGNTMDITSKAATHLHCWLFHFQTGHHNSRKPHSLKSILSTCILSDTVPVINKSRNLYPCVFFKCLWGLVYWTGNLETLRDSVLLSKLWLIKYLHCIKIWH